MTKLHNHESKAVKLNEKKISLVIPVYNEEDNLPELFRRLLPVMESLERSYEIILINDGSKDSSLPLMLREQKSHPQTVRVIDFNGNFGQHTAILAGFKSAKGQSIITLDADLQNPPEEIPKLISLLDEGHDVVGTVRKKRKDSFFRRYASKIVNKIMNKVTGFSIHDYGCMLRGYSREIIDIINECGEVSTFIPALAQKFAVNPIEIEVKIQSLQAHSLTVRLDDGVLNVPITDDNDTRRDNFCCRRCACLLGDFRPRFELSACRNRNDMHGHNRRVHRKNISGSQEETALRYPKNLRGGQ